MPEVQVEEFVFCGIGVGASWLGERRVRARKVEFRA
jgi:hypothetical protein